MNKTAALLNIIIVTVLLFFVGFGYLGTTKKYEQYEEIKGYFLVSKLHNRFFVCENSSYAFKQFDLADTKTEEKLKAEYFELSKGKSKPIYFEVIGKIDYSKHSGSSSIRFPDVITVQSIRLALDLKNEFCPYPQALLDMGFNKQSQHDK